MVSGVSFSFFFEILVPQNLGVQFDSRCVARTYISWAGSTTTQQLAILCTKN